MSETTDVATTFQEFVVNNGGPDIVLLRVKEVIQWLLGDLSFLPSIENVNKTVDAPKYKAHEDEWGRAIMKIRRPDLKLDKQWTNKFGEHICEELYTLLGKTVSKPVKKDHYQPDLEVDDAIIEAKTGTFHTCGTAGEKIFGSPVKYSDVPALYGKPLKIICMGGAEKYGILRGENLSAQKNKILECFREIGIEYVRASDIIKSLNNNNNNNSCSSSEQISNEMNETSICNL